MGKKVTGSDGSKRSRRDLLAAAAAAAGVIVAESAIGVPAAHAGTDGDVVLGSNNQTGSPTGIQNTGAGTALALSTSSSSVPVLSALNGGFAEAIVAKSNGTGIFAQSFGPQPTIHAENMTRDPGGAGIFGTSVVGEGIHGTTAAAGASGLVGENIAAGDGVLGKSAGGIGVHGLGNSDSSPAVKGENAQKGDGVLGTNVGGGIGVHGVASGASGGGMSSTGVFGEGGGSSDNTGVQANGGGPNGTGLIAIGVGAGNGVYAIAGQADGYGVEAAASGNNGIAVHAVGGPGDGTGVLGVGGSTNGTGVVGYGNGTGAGVRGSVGTADAIGVLADNEFGGPALVVKGPSLFSRSGLVSIAYPNKQATVTVPGGLDPASLVLATVQDTTGVYVKSAVPNPATGEIQINLNKAPGSGTNPKTATVAWFVIG